MKVLVTGGAGFIGSNVIDLLIEEGHETIIIDNLSRGNISNINSTSRFYNCDVLDLNKLKSIFKKEQPDVVIHNAAQIDVQVSLNMPASDAKINIQGTINVLECCRKYNVKKIIYPSSAAVYGDPMYLPVDEKHDINPISFYGISKHTPEHYIKAYAELYNIKYTVLRYSNVYGIRQDPKGEGGVISIFIDKFLVDESPVIFGDGNQTRDFIYVKDIARANLLALNNGENLICNISTQTQVSVNELTRLLKEILNSNLDIQYKEERCGDIKDSSLSNEKAKLSLKWAPEYDLFKGLSETCRYYNDLYESKKNL